MNRQRHSAWFSIPRGYIANLFKIHFRLQLLLFYIFLSLFFAQSSIAAIYRCTDNSGRKIFSDTPCTQGTKSVGTIDDSKTSSYNTETVENAESIKSDSADDLPKGVVPVVITGRVTFSNGDPIAGVEVLSWGLKDKKTDFKGMATTRTDANGSYKLSIDNRYLWVVYHHGTERQEFSRKGPWQSDATIDFVVPAK